MNPMTHPDLYQHILLENILSPGVVVPSGYGRKQAITVTEAKGQDGASTTRDGEKLCQFTVTFKLSNDETEYMPGVSEFDAWDEFRDLIESSTNGTDPKGLRIFHPDLIKNRISEVINGGIGDMVHDGLGGATIAVTFIEYKPPTPKPAKGASGSSGTGSKAAGGDTGPDGTADPDPNAAAKAELAALRAEAEEP
jgi:hypothetical protein